MVWVLWTFFLLALFRKSKLVGILNIGTTFIVDRRAEYILYCYILYILRCSICKPHKELNAEIKNSAFSNGFVSEKINERVKLL